MVRFLYYYFFISGEDKVQSLVIGSGLLAIGAITFIMGLIADLISSNRRLLEITLEKVRRLENRESELARASADHRRNAAGLVGVGSQSFVDDA